MKQSFTDAHREVTARMERENFRRDGDGRVILSMTVRDDSSFLSVYSEGETPVISSEVAEFLEKSTDTLRPDEELSLCIASDCIGEEEKKLYPAAVREYYARRYIANGRELGRNYIIVLLLGLMGVLALTASILYAHLVGNAVWAEVIDIVAWVFLWEAVDIGVLRNHSLRMNKLRYLAFLSMKIEYIPPKNTNGFSATSREIPKYE